MMRRRRRLSLRFGLGTLIAIAALSLFILNSGLEAIFFDVNLGERSRFELQEFWVCQLFEWFLGIWIFIVGSCIASFLNVVAYRLPAGMPVTGTSFCPHCRVPIRPSDNVPVFGWIFLRGRCRACKLSISSRYPIFELVGGLLMMSIYLSTILGHGANLPWQRHSELDYGMPVNLHFMDEAVFFVAGLHAWLLLFLYGGALTSFGNGRLPMKAWVIGPIGILFAIAIRPEICLLPIHFDKLQFGLAYFFAIPSAQALITSCFGGLMAIIASLLWRTKYDHRGWMMAWLMIGLALGWQATLWIFLIAAVAKVLQQRLTSQNPYFNAEAPIQFLWLWTGCFLIGWKWLYRFFNF